MALPTDLPTRVVTKTFLDQNGDPKKGPIDFELVGPLEQVAGGNRVDAHKTTVLVLSDGMLSVELIATGAAGWSSPIQYLVTERLTNADGTKADNPVRYHVKIPAGDGEPETWTPVELPAAPPFWPPVLPTLPSGGGQDGADGADGREIELSTSATHVRWRYVGDLVWVDLVSLAALTGPAGDDGLPGADGNDGAPGSPGDDGADGREVEIGVDAGSIAWRYVGDPAWAPIVALATLTGPAGADGEDGAPGTPGTDGEDGAPGAPGTDADTIEAHTFSSPPGPVAVGAGKGRVYVEGDYVVESVRAAVDGAPAGASLIVDVNKNGVTIYTTQGNRPAIAAGAFTAVGGVPDVTTFAAGDYLKVDVDQVGSVTPGSDLTVTVRLRKL